jgi:RimJ/RimL family protein N-acetyltransferase
MPLDNYIFDSQFLFLPDQELLQRAYAETVLKDLTLLPVNGVTAYIRKEQWDTDTFKKNIGRLCWLEDKINSRVTAENVMKSVKGFECCYLRLNSEHSFCEQAAKANLPLLSSKVSQHISLVTEKHKINSAFDYKVYSHSPEEEAILDQVLRLAANAFPHNRFSADSFFTPEMTGAIYSSWIRNEMKDPASDLYYIAEGDKLLSFFLYRHNVSPIDKYRIGFVSLIASSPEQKEKHHASDLLHFVLDKAKKSGTRFVIANTESKNTAALRFFKKNSFTPTALLNEYHIWN